MPRLLPPRAGLTPDFGAADSASHMLDLPLSTLEPGAYLLSMETRAGKSKTARFVRFSVK